MPSGHHKFNELLRGRRRRSKGSIEEALRECWLLVKVCASARDAAMEIGDFNELHRFVSLEISALRAYATLAIPGDLERRLRELEAGQDAQILTLPAANYIDVDDIDGRDKENPS